MIRQDRFRAIHLKELLAEHERSQNWLARKVGVSQSLMNYIVHGERTMSREQAEKIAELFGVPLFLVAESISADNVLTGAEQ